MIFNILWYYISNLFMYIYECMCICIMYMYICMTNSSVNPRQRCIHTHALTHLSSSVKYVSLFGKIDLVENGRHSISFHVYIYMYFINIYMYMKYNIIYTGCFDLFIGRLFNSWIYHLSFWKYIRSISSTMYENIYYFIVE